MSEELKPCPFCGGEAVKEYDSDWGIVVRCLECPAIMTESPYLGVLNPIEAWNTRSERTCRYEHIEGTWYKTSCGERYDGVVPPNYCPNCGGKVDKSFVTDEATGEVIYRDGEKVVE